MKPEIIQAIPDWIFVALKKWGWKGFFDSWKAALLQSGGYDADNILQRVRTASLRVKKGEALFERDSVLFNESEYCWELLAVLMWIAAQHNGSLNIIDFGGSLGSTYHQYKYFFASLRSVLWNIVEQPNFVRDGRRLFENESLKFYSSIDECVQLVGNNLDIGGVLLSGVLQYLEHPYSLLKDIVKRKLQYIIVDRTGFTLKNADDRLTVQTVHPKIYKASYPCWFFNEKKFLRFFLDRGYVLHYDFKSLDIANVPSVYKGFVFELNPNA